jgi:hypothetical protein
MDSSQPLRQQLREAYENARDCHGLTLAALADRLREQTAVQLSVPSLYRMLFGDQGLRSEYIEALATVLGITVTAGVQPTAGHEAA